MTNEAFQKTVIDQLVKMENQIGQLDSKTVTKADIEIIIAEQQKDVVAMLQLLRQKFDLQDAKLDLITHQLFEQETDIRLLKQA